MNINSHANQQFLDFLEVWLQNLTMVNVSNLAGCVDEIALVSVDLIKGFCDFGALASPRVADIVAPVSKLMTGLWQQGVRFMLLSQDAHAENAVEFSAWPAHCIHGSAEAETVDAIRSLPFFDQILTLEKNSIASGLNAELAAWVDAHPQVKSYIVVGDCTDLCTYQLAMFLRLSANEKQMERRVIVPHNCVATYDLSVETASRGNVLPHPGDLLQAVFLYHMALNGIEVVAEIQYPE